MHSVHAQIHAALQRVCADQHPNVPVNDALTPVQAHQGRGVYATAVALGLAKTLAQPPRPLAQAIADALVQRLPWITVEVAGPGFLNIGLSDAMLLAQVRHAYTLGAAFTQQANLDPVLLEYVSANPTGPLHIGHARGVVVGSALANLLKAAGHTVTTEYYVNDAGGQIADLALSALYWARQQMGMPLPVDAPPYPGAYLQEVATRLVADMPEAIKAQHPDLSPKGPIARHCVASMMVAIQADLAAMGARFDTFVSEAAITQGTVDAIIAKLRASGAVVDAALPPLPGKPAGAPRPVFLSTQWGDDKDRALTKDDGSLTYFGNDVVNHARKAARCKHLVTLLGEDHAGYTTRIKASVEALGTGARLDTPLVRMVHLLRNGTPVSMSKRAGTFETVSDLLDEVPSDVVRMSMLTRSADSTITFDLAEAVSEGPKNPVWSLNYAHARMVSVIQKATPSKATPTGVMDAAEREVARLVADWPRMVHAASASMEPHRIAGFARDMADAINAWWATGNSDATLRILHDADQGVTARRLAVAKGGQAVLAHALSILGVTPATTMARITPVAA